MLRRMCQVNIHGRFGLACLNEQDSCIALIKLRMSYLIYGKE